MIIFIFMNCPFCNNVVEQHGIYDVCKNHDSLFISYDSGDSLSICKYGYEINSYKRFNETFILKYCNDSNISHSNSLNNSIFSFDRWVYFGSFKIILKIDYSISLNPDNFDSILNKLIKLIPFS